MIRKSLSIIALLVLWQITALVIQKPVILPFPISVLLRMIEMLSNISFYQAIVSTFFRIGIAFMIAMIIGVGLGLLSGLFHKVNEYLFPIMSLIQTIPQIAYILIVLVWFSSFVSLIIIICLMLIPTFYHNTVNGIQAIDQELKDVIQLYHQPFFYTIRKVYLPLIRNYILSAVDTCLPLSLKIGVMAEIFVQTQFGIGTQLYFARIQIDMIGIFAWTLWMVVFIFIITTIYRYIIHRMK